LQKLGRPVTIQDIARVRPSAVKDPDKLEMVFGRMIALGIEFTDEDEKDNGSNVGDGNGESDLPDFLEKKTVPDDFLESDDIYSSLYSLYPLLSSEDVSSLARTKENGRKARRELFELLKNDTSPQSETTDGIKEVIREGASAQDTLVLHNLRLVPYLIEKYFFLDKDTFPFDELESAGREELIKAAIRYNPDRRIAFSTYACNVIRWNVQRYIQKNSFDFSTGFRTVNQRRIVLKAIAQFKNESGKTPTVDDLHQLTGLSPKILIGLLNISNVVSIDEPIFEKFDSASREEVTADPGQRELFNLDERINESNQLPNRIFHREERKILFDQLQDEIREKIQTLQLTAKEGTAIELRLSRFPLLTYKEVATRMQLSSQRVDQLLEHVLIKLSADSSISTEEALLISDLVRGRSTSKFDKTLWK
ncbi:sigma-70 family RNA polymerase sigma factor, partial [Patescibacteria group bacterium]|nr:sigma-70 family RNA polymerase sigma factor [Patescibacteria group bacterium]